MESTSSHDYNLIEAEEDMEELIAEVKSEGDDEWIEQNNERCGEVYPPGSMSPRSGKLGLFKSLSVVFKLLKTLMS